MKTHNEYIVEIDNTALVCNYNIDQILILIYWKPVSYFSMNPIWLIYILYVLHEHPSWTHLFSLTFKTMRDSEYFVSLGTISYFFRPR